MKGSVVFGWLILLISTQAFGTVSDTTVTSFEIHLKRNVDPLGFNTCNIDRQHIYELVVKNLRQRFSASKFKSMHDPLVLMKFTDVNKHDKFKSEISVHERNVLKSKGYAHFIKICANFDVDKALNRQQVATLTLRVFVFDSQGKLISKCKSKSREKIVLHDNNPESASVNESQFFDMLTEAADSLELSI